MNAIAFRSSLNQLMRDARQFQFSDPHEHDEETEVYSESVPSPDEIRRRCLEIQKGWSPRERMKRAGLSPREASWTPPLVTVCEMDV